MRRRRRKRRFGGSRCAARCSRSRRADPLRLRRQKDRRGKTPTLFRQGLFAAEQSGKWGFVDKTGAFVLEPQFEEASSFYADGYAVVVQDGKYGVIDRKGAFVLRPEPEGIRDDFYMMYW